MSYCYVYVMSLYIRITTFSYLCLCMSVKSVSWPDGLKWPVRQEALQALQIPRT